MGTAARGQEHVVGSLPDRHAKVCDLDVLVAVKKEVLQLEITMNDLLLVNIPDAGDELCKKFAGVLLFEVTMGQNVVEELSSGCIF